MTNEEIDRDVTLCCDVAARLQREGNHAESLAVISAACALRNSKPVDPAVTPNITVSVGGDPVSIAECITPAIDAAGKRGLRPRL